MLPKAALIALAVLAAPSTALCLDFGDSGSEKTGKTRKTVSFGAEAEAFAFDMPLVLDEFDGEEWDGEIIIGEATQDTDKNAEYGALRIYSGFTGFMDLNPAKEVSIRISVKMGTIKEVYQAEHDTGSFFRDTDEEPDTDTANFRMGTLFGAGAMARLNFEEFWIAAEGAFSWDHVSYRNQEWFLERTYGRLNAVCIDIRVTAGYSFGFVTPKAGFGALVYSARGHFHQIYANNNRNDHFYADFSAATPFALMVGADFDGGEHLFSSLELVLFGEYGLRFSFGLRI